MAVVRVLTLSVLAGFVVLACGSRSDVDALYDEWSPSGGSGSGGSGGGPRGGRPNGGNPGGGFGGIDRAGAGGVAAAGGVPIAGGAGQAAAGGVAGRGGGVAGGGGRGGQAGGGGRGGAPPGSCCTPHAAPGCSNPSISVCVCAKDAYCCQQTWDATCVDEVELFGCGTCAGGSGGVGGTAGTAGTGGNGSVCNAVTDACGACLCAFCLNAVEACVGDARCLAILECTERTGCQGLDCYEPNTCQRAIDASGGPLNLSMQRLGAMLGCGINAGCACN